MEEGDEPADEPRCRTCGATDKDGNGRVRVYKSVMQCARCKQGAIDLIKAEPENYGWDPGRGGLYRKTPDLWVEQVEADVRALYDALRAAVVLEEVDATVELTHPQSFVSLLMPNGYRWHLYSTKSDPTGRGIYTVRLFTADRDAAPNMFSPAGETVPEAAEFVAMLTAAAVKNPDLRGLIEQDASRRAEVDAVDMDALVRQLLDAD